MPQNPYYNLTSLEVRTVQADFRLNVNLGTVVKYLARAGYKSAETEERDIAKARDYLRFELERPYQQSISPRSVDYVLQAWDYLTPERREALRCVLLSVQLPYERNRLLDKALSLLV
jgi:hypothetical protein